MKGNHPGNYFIIGMAASKLKARVGMNIDTLARYGLIFDAHQNIFWMKVPAMIPDTCRERKWQPLGTFSFETNAVHIDHCCDGAVVDTRKGHEKYPAKMHTRDVPIIMPDMIGWV